MIVEFKNLIVSFKNLNVSLRKFLLFLFENLPLGSFFACTLHHSTPANPLLFSKMRQFCILAMIHIIFTLSSFQNCMISNGYYPSKIVLIVESRASSFQPLQNISLWKKLQWKSVFSHLRFSLISKRKCGCMHRRPFERKRNQFRQKWRKSIKSETSLLKSICFICFICKAR